MTIMAVDNFTPRLSQLYSLLGEIYPNDEITVFNDPFYAVQYSQNHGVDIAFVHENICPISHNDIFKLVQKFNENAKLYLIEDDLNRENPVSREKIETLITVPV